jgi:hypothetical protein
VKQQSDSDEYQVDGKQEHSEVFGDVHGFCLKQHPSFCTLKIGAEKSLRIPAYHLRSPLVNSDPGAHFLKLHCLPILFLETQCATGLYLGRVKKAHFRWDKNRVTHSMQKFLVRWNNGGQCAA